MKQLFTCFALALVLPTSAAIFVVTNANDSGVGSFRWAIENANTNTGFNEIHFQIFPEGIQVISPLTLLPAITNSLRIAGETQPGYAGTPLIELDGRGLIGYGLEILTNGCTISALAIHDFYLSGYGPDGLGYQIRIKDASQNVVTKCYLGLDAHGAGKDIHSTIWQCGLMLYNAPLNLVVSNVISGNGFGFYPEGIWIFGEGSVSNVVESNFIGTDPSGTVAVRNWGDGIRIQGASFNRIGGSSASAANVISANFSNGVHFTAGAAYNLVQQNFIGTDPSGLLPLGNRFNGIFGQRALTNRIDLGNIIGDNGTYGIFLDCDAFGCSQGNIVEDNSIGQDVLGEALGNHLDGIHLRGISTEGNIIGTLTGYTVNFISYNLGAGIAFECSHNEIYRNFVEYNHSDGVQIYPAQHHNPVAYNLIRYNERDGVRISGDNNLVTANTIAGNSANGVTVLSETPTTGFNNLIRSNSITVNGLMGIDLGNDGLTVNDDQDLDSGANHKQNFPSVFLASHDAARVRVTGTFNSSVSSTFALDFYLNSLGDPYQGQRFLGTTTVSTDLSGNADFDATFLLGDGAVPGWIITATANATDSFTGMLTDTSEFSRWPTSPTHVGEEGQLGISLEGPNIRLFWRELLLHFQLQWSPPGPKLDWKNWASQPVGNNGDYSITEALFPQGRLYRLISIQLPTTMPPHFQAPPAFN